MSKKIEKFSALTVTFICIFASILGFVAGFLGYAIIDNPTDSDVYVSGDLSIHFLELGNKFIGDCTLIKVGHTDILVDAGSKTSSIPTISEYLDEHVVDDVIEYVIITHAHEDHYAGFATNTETDSLFDLFEFKTIIDFPLTNQTGTQYQNYVRERDAEVASGATHYNALECYNNENGAQAVYDLGNDIELEILYNYYYEHTYPDDENNYSVCFTINQGDKKFLFTGDLEADGESYLVDNNDIGKVELYKAGHHGSRTSSSSKLMKEIQPNIVCVCCCAGSPQHKANALNTFPSQDFVNNVGKYTDLIYVTTLCVDYDNDIVESMNGIIVVTSNSRGVTVECSNNNTILKDTEWFKANRTWPSK